MPLGIIIILISAILIAFDLGETISYALALSKGKSVVFLLLMTFSYMIRPFSLEGITFYWLPYICLLFYGIYLLSKLEHALKSILLSIFSSLALYILSLIILPQPIGLIYEPFTIYALLLIIINVLFSYGTRSVIHNSVFSMILFNSIMIFRETYNNIIPPEAFNAICIASLVSCFPVSILASKKIYLRHKRLFQSESGEELFYKHKSRKW